MPLLFPGRLLPTSVPHMLCMRRSANATFSYELGNLYSISFVSPPTGCAFAVRLATVVVHDQAQSAEHEGDSQCEETPTHRHSQSVDDSGIESITAAAAPLRDEGLPQPVCQFLLKPGRAGAREWVQARRALAPAA